MAVPAIASQTAQAIDPHMRDARNLLDAIKARVPVLSESVPVRRDIWGEEVRRGESVGPDLLSPVYSSRISSDPVRREVARLRVPLSAPQRFLRVNGKRVDLTPQQFDELQQLTGKPARAYLEQHISSAEWKRMNDDERVEFVREAFKEFRATARDTLKQRYPELGGEEKPKRGNRSEPANSNFPPLPPGARFAQ
jgi:DNA-binding response OmpR family regulator